MYVGILYYIFLIMEAKGSIDVSNSNDNSSVLLSPLPYNCLDLLSATVNRIAYDEQVQQNQLEHRVSCHRCGNIRKRKVFCSAASCPHIFCGRCADKMKEEYGSRVFIGGCPVCTGLCCCNSKTQDCNRKNHCYRKCPSTKVMRKPKVSLAPGKLSVTESTRALDFLAAVASSNPSESPNNASTHTHLNENENIQSPLSVSFQSTEFSESIAHDLPSPNPVPSTTSSPLSTVSSAASNVNTA